MDPLSAPTRRAFLRNLSLTGVGVIWLGSGCTKATVSTTAPVANNVPTTTSPPPRVTTLPPPPGSGFDWEKIRYGVATPYLLHSGQGVVLVDTGKSGSEAAIGGTLDQLDLTWPDVDHIILTHQHRDNTGALPEVAALATEATIHAGAGDILELPMLPGGRQVRGARDGERILDLTIIETPGHTPGHISVLDQAAGVLIDGDLVVVRRGEISGPSLDSSDDIDATYASLSKLAQYQYETILIARGEPILTGGSDVMALIASLPH